MDLKAGEWAFRHKSNGNTADVRAAKTFVNQKQMMKLLIQNHNLDPKSDDWAFRNKFFYSTINVITVENCG